MKKHFRNVTARVFHKTSINARAINQKHIKHFNQYWCSGRTQNKIFVPGQHFITKYGPSVFFLMFLSIVSNKQTTIKKKCIKAYVGSNKLDTYALQRSGHSNLQTSWKETVQKDLKGLFLPLFAIGSYQHITVDTKEQLNTFRLVFQRDVQGPYLRHVITPALVKRSKEKFGCEIDGMRSGVLFLEGLAGLELKQGEELLFICDHRENKKVLTVLHVNQKQEIHTIIVVESDILVDSIEHVFGGEKSSLVKFTATS
ncbi:hypothetical protein RFI_25432 [Reticulomyxa filosa]|uniref:Uncharacterized protein n=1 Tax=Reticulomyxa filosa TaxID=46433 RepID=X6MDJ9_RETFI|nr:hypothetical protein RFI_25432 [Reticulomyxa filosa]|eukprot:ETO11944.1 hypothetical protein RFI_25432 [Reticulomyxa filosa]